LTPLVAQEVPVWVNNIDRAFPTNDWVAVIAQGSSQPEAENAAMNALARAFKTDVASLAQTSRDADASANVNGLIGVQTDVYQAPDSTVYVNARMNRRESTARYSGMIGENVAVIDRLLAVPEQGTFDAYSRLSFAHSIAQVTDNFQNILEVLDPTATNRRPGYGGANAINAKMLECAALITIGIVVDTEQAADKTLLTRAAGSFFTDLGFRINEQGAGNYVLRANVRFEEFSRNNLFYCTYYLDAAMENKSGAAVFSFTGNDREGHLNAANVRPRAVRAVETSLKNGKFAQEFGSWLNSLR
jgi:hypothetical protein